MLSHVKSCVCVCVCVAGAAEEDAREAGVVAARGDVARPDGAGAHRGSPPPAAQPAGDRRPAGRPRRRPAAGQP